MDFINKSGIGNLILSFSNILIVPCLTLTWNVQDYYTFYIALFIGSASFISHLFQNKYNGLWGFNASVTTFIVLNTLDVIGAWVTVSRVCYLYVNTYGLVFDGFLVDPVFLGLFFAALCFGMYTSLNRNDEVFFVWLHSMWHILVLVCCMMLYYTFIHMINKQYFSKN